MRALILMLGLVAAPAVAADQFDLVCKGQYQERVNAKWKPIEAHYRIDVATRAWCGGACTGVEKLASIDAGKIVFSRTDPADKVGPYAVHEVDRVSGHYRHYSAGGSLGMFWDEDGSCIVKPFSGFPATKF